MANTKGRPKRYRPLGGKAGEADALIEYSPQGTGCPAVEQAISLLYTEKDEESFWTLMSALNYALELETRVLVPLHEAPVVHSEYTPWVGSPVPAAKAANLQKWTVRRDNGQSWLPLFTSSVSVLADRATAFRPLAELPLLDALEYALNADEISGVVIDPWTRSASLDNSLLRGLLRAGSDTEAGEADFEAALAAYRRGDWAAAAQLSKKAAEAGSTDGLTLLGECCYLGLGVRRSRADGRRLWKLAAEAGGVRACVLLGDDCLSANKSLGKPLTYYRKAMALARRQPDIAYMPEVCLRIAQAEAGFIAGKRPQAVSLTAEAIQGFKIRQREGDPDAAARLEEAEAFMRELLKLSQRGDAYKESLQLD